MPDFKNQQPDEEEIAKDYQYLRNGGWNSLNLTLKYMQRDIDEIKRTVKEDKSGYVSREEFDPIKKIVYGLVGLILTGVIGALMTLLLRK